MRRPVFTMCVECRRKNIPLGELCPREECQKMNAPVSYNGFDVTTGFTGVVTIDGTYIPFEEG